MNVGESATNDVEVRTPQSDDLAFESERETQDGQLCRLERVHCYDSLPSLDGAVDLGLDEPDDDEKPYRVSPARRVSCKINSGDDLSYGVKCERLSSDNMLPVTATNLKDQSSLSFEDIQTLSKANIKPDVSLFPGSHEELQRRSDCRAEEGKTISSKSFKYDLCYNNSVLFVIRCSIGIIANMLLGVCEDNSITLEVLIFRLITKVILLEDRL
eukprot:GHVL01010798.1.p2 GENE.GHVL01010798.1~~GHVL01010798.1.p2  ORF type:complete len:214 (-),score=28.69 GHVL01010798.1:1375-2016(-)